MGEKPLIWVKLSSDSLTSLTDFKLSHMYPSVSENQPRLYFTIFSTKPGQFYVLLFYAKWRRPDSLWARYIPWGSWDWHHARPAAPWQMHQPDCQWRIDSSNCLDRWRPSPAESRNVPGTTAQLTPDPHQHKWKSRNSHWHKSAACLAATRR